MEEVKIYKCFIASPGDTTDERKICDVVFQKINKNLGEKLSFRIESKKWEDDARPGFAGSAQGVINKQLLNNFQLFIGIMFTHFGSPTKEAESGTEEEFNIAYENKDNVEIMFYFNNKELSPSEIDPAQLTKVKAFKDRLSSKGGLYSEYIGANDFENQLRKHLEKYFLENHKPTQINNHISNSDLNTHNLRSRLTESLSTFSNQPTVWVDPVISKSKNLGNDKNNTSEVVIIDDFIINPYSAMVKAPPQFGLTCLSHYLVLQAYKSNHLWAYVDMSTVNIHTDAKKIIKKELNKLNVNDENIKCIILDSWKPSLTGSMKVLRGLCNTYPKVPILVMHTMGDFSRNLEKDINISRQFKELTLSALSRNSIRKVVSEYNTQKNLGDENIVLNKVVDDMDILNIHRTPLNCLTLLKISEKHFDESPVNRTKMIGMFLFVLFDLVELPTYKTKPDVKDCEHVLGFFCEQLIRNNAYEFSKDEFLKTLNSFCEEKLLDL
ncbi:hypothetical protein, partial [Cycloclasticus pugetii]|uniref:hypothetical protein n=1 Tax=Cycloclasticus pugetii TaxID=34068 RepID=UPI002409D9AB